MAAKDHDKDFCNKLASSFNEIVNAEYSFQLFLFVKNLL